MHLVFTNMLGYKKFCLSSSSSFVGDEIGDPDLDGPLILSVGRAVSSSFGVFFGAVGKYDDEGSAWHSTSSNFSLSGEFRLSSLSQILFDGFSEKRRCWNLIGFLLCVIQFFNQKTYISIPRWYIFCTFRLSTEHTLRSIASNELNWVETSSFWWNKYGRI